MSYLRKIALYLSLVLLVPVGAQANVVSDFFTGTGRCTGNFDTPCSGGTGFWALDSATAPVSVPSPAIWSLFGLAVLGVFGVGRAKARGAV